MLDVYYRSADHAFNLLHGDTFDLLPQFDFKFDMIFADPPYFLSSGGISVQSGKIVCVDKGDWDRSMSQDEITTFNLNWLSLCREKLKDNGTIWISGTYHNIFSVANALTQLGYKILNVITWAKTNPPPNISCRYFTYSTEFIIWARKFEKVPHLYNYELMKEINGGTQMTDVWRLPAIAPWEKTCTKHPTQKPLGLLCRIILASTKNGDWILDPFAGSSTTGIAANLLGRRFLGIEREEQFVAISKSRYKEIEDGGTYASYRRKIPDIVKAEATQASCLTCNEPTIEELPFLKECSAIEGDGVLMYAVGDATRKMTEPIGKIALGIKKEYLQEMSAHDIGYIMFHYWNNEQAKMYSLTDAPKLVNKSDIPEDFLVRQETGAKKFMLMRYNPKHSAKIGTFDISRVQRKGSLRYMPFVTKINNIIKNKE